MNRYIDKKLILKIYQLTSEAGDLAPALEDVETHEVTPMWVAGLMYIILDRYLTCIEDSNQKEFKETTIKWLAEMVKDDQGSAYVETIDPNKFD
jgi:hypothetical protein